jgi:hypothetical protein
MSSFRNRICDVVIYSLFSHQSPVGWEAIGASSLVPLSVSHGVTNSWRLLLVFPALFSLLVVRRYEDGLLCYIFNELGLRDAYIRDT